MQRTQRSKAGNIYKKRLEEIQLELSTPKSKKKKAVKKSKRSRSNSSSHVKPIPSQLPKSGEGFDSKEEDREERSECVEAELVLKEEAISDGEEDMELRPRSNRSSTSSTSQASSARSTSTRSKKNLNHKFGCPHCPASFAEERYVQFHCEQKHKSTSAKVERKEERKLTKQSVHEAKMHFKQLTQRSPSFSTGNGSSRSGSDGENGQDETEAMDFEEESRADGGDFMEHDNKEELSEDNLEEFYEKVHTGGIDMFRCNKCVDFQVASKHVMLTHIQRHVAAMPNHKCPYCRFRAKSRSCLEVHIYNHTGVKPFCCKVCDLSFKCMDELLVHSQSDHSPDDLVAGNHFLNAEPGKPTSSVQPTRFLQGNQSIPKKSSNKCPYCSEKFLSRVNLETHINIHKLKGITDEEREQELRSLEEPEEEEDVQNSTEDSPLKLLPPRPKRRPERYSSARMKKKREAEEAEDIEAEKRRLAIIMDGPPRCKLCSKVFLYTTTLEKHMTNAHGVHPQEPPTAATKLSLDKPEEALTNLQLSAGAKSPPPLVPVSASTKPDSVDEGSAADSEEKPEESLDAIRTRTNGTQEPASNSQLPKKLTEAAVTAPTTAAETTGDKNQPIKSVFLLFDPSNNTVIPVSPSLLGYPDAEGESKSSKSPSDREALAMQKADALVDQEIASELEKFGKPGMPLSAGADNQHMEHQCVVCQEKIMGYTEIVKHFHTHTVDDYSCHLCQKRFSSKSSLGVHFLIHVGITFSCPLCNKKLSKKQSLLEHIRYHKGERRHVCSTCGKAFITSSSLNRHVRMHEAQRQTRSPSKPFNCAHCNRSFQEQSSFAQHIRAHRVMNMHATVPKAKEPNTTIPFRCQYCDKLWGSALGLSRHLKVEHGLGVVLPPSQNPVCDTPPPPPLIRKAVRPATQTQVVLTEAPESMKIIDVIEISDDEEETKAIAETEILVPEIEIETLPDGEVNIEFQDVGTTNNSSIVNTSEELNITEESMQPKISEEPNGMVTPEPTDSPPVQVAGEDSETVKSEMTEQGGDKGSKEPDVATSLKEEELESRTE